MVKYQEKGRKGTHAAAPTYEDAAPLAAGMVVALSVAPAGAKLLLLLEDEDKDE